MMLGLEGLRQKAGIVKKGFRRLLLGGQKEVGWKRSAIHARKGKYNDPGRSLQVSRKMPAKKSAVLIVAVRLTGDLCLGTISLDASLNEVDHGEGDYLRCFLQTTLLV